MDWARPWVLTLWLLLPVWLWLRVRRATRIALPSLSMAAEARGRAWWPIVPVALRVLALALLIAAAAGPRLGERTLRLRGEGVAVVLALDVSSSMLAEDFAPSNRLEVAKAQALAFIRSRRSDRIGLVAFAGEALTQVPLTLDYAVLERAVMALRVGLLEDGTAIGTGLATSVARLRQAPLASRVVVLLTDGESNRGAIDPRSAAAAAAALGVRVYTIGVGTEGEARVPTGRGLSGLRYELVPVRIDEVLLRDIADGTGGRYFRAGDASALAEVFRQINEMERSTAEEDRYGDREESVAPLVAVAMLLLLLELLVGATRVVRVP